MPDLRREYEDVRAARYAILTWARLICISMDLGHSPVVAARARAMRREGKALLWELVRCLGDDLSCKSLLEFIAEQVLDVTSQAPLLSQPTVAEAIRFWSAVFLNAELDARYTVGYWGHLEPGDGR